MKLIAFYLPQFHEIEENRRAWGEGFTEWVNVKKAKSLFEGHNQPRIPLNNNYYNLLDINTIKWQAMLAKEYGLHGFCFYHYWFKNGKHVLEKPAEMLLANKDIQLPFCFSWANEPWTKTWHGAAGEKEILIEQRYGGKEQWKAHFDYLLPFFLDDRYIKVSGRPMLLIYQINKIACFNRMIDYWNELANNNGIEGLYIVDMLMLDGKISKNKRVSASVDCEPSKNRRKSMLVKEENKYIIESYDDVCKSMLSSIHKKNEYRCMFVDYDDSPRRGSESVIFQGSEPEKFGMYLQKTINCSEKENNEFVFINAWNEWGESNYLEPDEKYKYEYLEQVKAALKGECKEICIAQENASERVVDVKEKFRSYYDLCNSWIKLYNDGYKIEDYFLENGYKSIAIYGMGELGNRLVEALSESKIEVKYGISKDVVDAFAEIDIFGLEEKEKFTDIDCIVVSPIHLFKEIYDDLKNKSDCDIISLEDVIAGI